MLAMMQILAFGFLTPWLMGAGAAATSIPIIIHLLNKRKFRIVIWAAMDFLLAAQRRNARRLRFQRWLLLALRCLALLVIAAGIAQMILSSTVLGGMLGGQRVVILVWDDSYSMAYQRPGGPSAFDRSKKLIGDWLGGVTAADKVMIIRASRFGTVAGNKPTLDHKGLQSDVAAATASDAGTDLASALDQAAETLRDLEKSTSARQVVVLTDLSRSSITSGQWSVASGQKGEADGEHLKKSVEALKKVATTVRVVDLGSAEQSNTAVVEVRAQRPVVVAASPTEFRITVLNATDRAQIDLPLTVSLDGVIVHTEKLGKIDPGSARSVLVSATVQTPGRHFIEAKLPPDLLPIDDTRRLMINVQREIPVLLVDGSPPDNRTLGSTTYLAVAYALSADGKSASVFAPRVITELELGTTALPGYAAVVLSDTVVPGKSVRDALRKYVEDGGLLMVFPGNRTDGLNEALGEGGAKLLPAPYGQPVKLEGAQGAAEGIKFDPEGFTHPVLEIFHGAEKSGTNVGFTTVQTSHYMKMAVPKDGSVETILRYAAKDGTADAAVVTKPVGKGRVVQFASTADTRWNSFAAKPSFVPFMHELTYYAMPREGEALTLAIGEKINLAADAASPGSWTAPRNQRVSVTTEIGKDGRARLGSAPLTMAGLYAPTTGSTAPVIAVNTDADEADIRHIAPAAFAAATGLEAGDIVPAPRELEVQSTEITKNSSTSVLGRYLILAALGLFMLETVLARVFSMYR